jgi:hypothetical protein
VTRAVHVVCLVCLACAACAEAGRATGGGPTDASGSSDGTKAIDARVQMDAPAQSGACSTTATCTAPTMVLPNVSGDSGGTASASGYQSAWYQVRIGEDDNGPFAAPMSFTVQLTSPAATNYDLFIYINTGSDVIECTTPNGTATKTGTTQSERLSWGEGGTFANGSDDGRTLSIEVRAPATGCSSGAQWQLQIVGET